MKRYAKKTERALLGKEKHRVLIFGETTCGPNPLKVTHDSCHVQLVRFPREYDELEDLSEYTLVVLDYSAFLIEDRGGRRTVYAREQEVFEKQMLKALRSGTCFCIVHYDDTVPREDRYASPARMDQGDVDECRQLQIGFRWLDKFSIKPIKVDSPILTGELRRSEFQPYVDAWGTSKIAFRPYGEGTFSDIIVGVAQDYALAFTLNWGRGKLIYVPCQRDLSRPDRLSDLFTALIDSLVTYLTKTRMELPDWAETPMFAEEKELGRSKAELESKLAKCQEKLDTFYAAKQLLFQSEYGLEEAVTKFLQEQCGIAVEREETYKEDLWLLDPDGEKVVICEVKSYVKGFKKSGLFGLYNHRESYDLDENFPAVVFVNANLNAASWKQKCRPIDKQNYHEAADKHLLVVRIEDLVFAWQALREGTIDSSHLLSIFTDEVGWLRFNRNGSWEILK